MVTFHHSSQLTPAAFDAQTKTLLGWDRGGNSNVKEEDNIHKTMA
jgi:hypothetical protein